MTRSLESRFVFGFSFHRASLLLLLGLRRMLFSAGFLFALLVIGELSASERFRILGVRALPSAPCKELCPP
jgi:hypothetical protein